MNKLISVYICTVFVLLSGCGKSNVSGQLFYSRESGTLENNNGMAKKISNAEVVILSEQQARETFSRADAAYAQKVSELYPSLHASRASYLQKREQCTQQDAKRKDRENRLKEALKDANPYMALELQKADLAASNEDTEEMGKLLDSMKPFTLQETEANRSIDRVVIEALLAGPSLAHCRTDADGKFTAVVPNGEIVIVAGYQLAACWTLRTNIPTQTNLVISNSNEILSGRDSAYKHKWPRW
ncbi:MAG: hypothetical protein WC378_17655 [Opitutaceae bacterium]